VLLEKIPYFALALAGAATSYYAVWVNVFVTSLDKYPWPARLGMTMYSLAFYVTKTLVPVSLSPLYELPATVNPLEPRFALSAAAVVALSVAALALARRWPAGLALWAYYGIVLGPVTGLVHSGFQLAHDRYSYLSCLGWALLVGAAAGALARAQAAGVIRPLVVRLAGLAAAVWVLALGTLTWNQVQIWRDTDTLWRYAVESDPRCALCQSNLGATLMRMRLYTLSKEKYERALALRPDRIRNHHGIGAALANLGDTRKALEHFDIALAKYPNDPDLLNNLAGALMKEERREEGMRHLERALRIRPDHVAALTNLGTARLKEGRAEVALAHIRRAVELKPEEAMPHCQLARVYLALGRNADALAEYAIVRSLDPRLAAELAPDFLALW
jgi:Tfp pilus assembly protein PilF